MKVVESVCISRTKRWRFRFPQKSNPKNTKLDRSAACLFVALNTHSFVSILSARNMARFVFTLQMKS